MDQANSQVNSLLEHGWFFGNSLANKPRTPTTSSSSKMVRCLSDPSTSTSSSKKAEAEEEEVAKVVDQKKMTNGLHRTPSLPVSWGRDTKCSEQEEAEDEEEEEPRMGDLIRQAMPLAPSGGGGRRRLDRTPSLPPIRATKVGPTPLPPVGGLTRRSSIDSTVLLSEKGLAMPNGMPKLSRRASIDSSIVLPPKYSSKATKHSNSSSKNRPQRKMELPNVNEHNTKEEPRSPNLNKIKSQKSPSDLEIEELQGFKDLGFSFDNKQVNPSVAQVLPALQRRASIASSSFGDNAKVRRPYLSEAWQRQPTSSPISAPPILKRPDQKPPSAEDMKAQIKFWARAVASNVRQDASTIVT